jgi:hypothetical protein
MSGFEVVGIALAVIPLALSTVEQYAKIYELLLTTTRSEVMNKKLEQVYRDLLYQITLMQLSMDRLFKDLHIPRGTLSEWKMVEVLQWSWMDTALQHRLGGAANSFNETTNALTDLLNKIAKDKTLGLSTDDIVKLTRPLTYYPARNANESTGLSIRHL